MTSLKENIQAISPLIGAILMVLIAIAGVSALYIYLENIANQNIIDDTIEISLVKDENNNTLLIKQINSTKISWEDFKIQHDPTIQNLILTTQNTSYTFIGKTWYTDETLTTAIALTDVYISNGDYLFVNGTGTVTISHRQSSTQIGSWTFQ
jgi:hypothetical protein